MRKIIVFLFVFLLCFNVVVPALESTTEPGCNEKLCPISFKETTYWVDSSGSIYSDQAGTYIDLSEGALLREIEASSDYQTAITFFREKEAEVSSSSSSGGAAVPSVREPAKEKDPEKILVKDIQKKVEKGETTFSEEYDNRIASAQEAMRRAQTERREAYKRGFVGARDSTTIKVDKKEYTFNSGEWKDSSNNNLNRLLNAPGINVIDVGGVTYTKTPSGWQSSDGTNLETTLNNPLSYGTIDIGGVQYTRTSSWTGDDGTQLKNGAKVTAAKGEATYDGLVWRYNDNKEVPPDEISAALSLQSPEEKKALAQAKEYEKEADWIEWRGSWYEGLNSKDGIGWYNILAKGQYGSTEGAIFTGIVSGATRVTQYQATSNLLAKIDFFESWVDQANADWMRKWQNVEGFAVAAICKEDDLKRSKSPGTTTQMVQTVSSYQFVGSIQAEVSSRKVPILCTKEIKDEQEQFTCPGELFCINNEFCAANEDATTPANGYFYKLSWGVTAPTDEKSTPFIDEEGNAIKLNLRLEDENGNKVFFYKRANQQNENTIELRNGDHDGNTHAFYSPTRYVEACIIFSSGYQVKDLSGDPIKRICATFKTTERGKVEFENSNRQPSITTSSGEVQVNTNI